MFHQFLPQFLKTFLKILKPDGTLYVLSQPVMYSYATSTVCNELLVVNDSVSCATHKIIAFHLLDTHTTTNSSNIHSFNSHSFTTISISFFITQTNRFITNFRKMMCPTVGFPYSIKVLYNRETPTWPLCQLLISQLLRLTTDRQLFIKILWFIQISFPLNQLSRVKLHNILLVIL